MSQDGNNRVLECLRAIHGKEPTPLRSCLYNEDVAALAAMCTGSRVISCDLDTDGYAGRWRDAVEGQVRIGKDPKEWDFWHAARLLFFELGGNYKAGMAPTRKYRT